MERTVCVKYIVPAVTYALVLVALADPTRREIVQRLRNQPRTVTELATALPVSQPAVSQHLRVLREAGVVRSTPDGRRRVYTLELRGLEPLRAYVESFWEDVLDAYQQSWTATATATATEKGKRKK